MTVQLKAEHEELIDRAIQAGLIHGADEVLDAGVDAIRHRLERHDAVGRSSSADEWSREFHAWVRGHSTTTPLLSDEDISRDSIYGTRGI
jgi:hypothetical protein